MSPEEEAEAYGRDYAWFCRYVAPFYMKYVPHGSAASAKMRAREREMRARSAELSRDDVELLLSMHWRLQVMGAWYAIIANDPTLLGPVIASLNRCGGSLTATELCAAAVVYADDSTIDALRAYRRRVDLDVYYSALREGHCCHRVPRRAG